MHVEFRIILILQISIRFALQLFVSQNVSMAVFVKQMVAAYAPLNSMGQAVKKVCSLAASDVNNILEPIQHSPIVLVLFCFNLLHMYTYSLM